MNVHAKARTAACIVASCAAWFSSPVSAGEAGTLIGLIGSVPRQQSGTVESARPSDAEAAVFDAALTASFDGTRSPPPGYRIATVVEDGRRFHALVPAARGFAPIVIVAERPLRDAILQAPHPEHDRATAEQAVLFLGRLGARAAIVSAHHRCAASAASPCSGRTGACGGGSRAYRESDPAHNPALLFHRAHERLATLWPTAVVVQLHGFAGRGYRSLFILSDGSGEARPGDPTLAGRVRDRIRTALADEPAAVSCQDPDDGRFRFPALCARTNVQGRALNGSADVCRRNAPRASGRFLHIEQDWSVREPVRRDGRDALGDRRLRALFDALAAELPCIAAECRR